MRVVRLLGAFCVLFLLGAHVVFLWSVCVFFNGSVRAFSSDVGVCVFSNGLVCCFSGVGVRFFFSAVCVCVFSSTTSKKS